MGHATSILLSRLCLILLNLLFFAGTPQALAGDAIRINGSGSGLEMMKPLIEGYGKASRGVTFIMEKPLGSSGAIKALLAGAIDIAVTSKPLKPEEIARGGKLRYFGKTPLAIVTEKNVPLKTISIKELEDIYSGKTTKWPNGETIRIVLRPNEDIDTHILKGLSPGMAEAVTKAQRRQGMIIAVTDPESNDMVAKTAGSIGASGLTGVIVGKEPLHVLALDGVMPSRKALAGGTYPLAKNINFVTTGKLPHAAAKFLAFIYSNKGRAIAEKAGVLITADGK
ncbi:MAG TPA: ABC transporter substrate-binding protein [Syntrophus sp. (in: bacteria)]|jgi:phosphate transport system substrate-binding protein|nr:ABC transporter substrate-binding protein [Syntrophus sp. (in: bacteria)]